MTTPARALPVADAPPIREAPRAGPPISDAALTARFATDLDRLWSIPERSHARGGRLGLAISGGPDSTALLLLANAALPGAVEAATVDHGLRAESRAEAEAVARLCEAIGVPHVTLTVEVAAGNLQAEARRARYAAMAAWLRECGLAALATGHHADDQAETLLLRLNRASGVAGLAGARAQGRVPGAELPLLRPLLGWRRSELAAIVSAAGLSAVDDRSNHDARFDRVRLRHAIAGADWLDIPAIAASAAHLADADAALDWAAEREWATQVGEMGLGVVYRPQAPRAVALRVIARIVAKLDQNEPRGGVVATVFEALLAGRTASIGNLVARPMAGGWSFARAPRRAPRPIAPPVAAPLAAPGRLPRQGDGDPQ